MYKGVRLLPKASSMLLRWLNPPQRGITCAGPQCVQDLCWPRLCFQESIQQPRKMGISSHVK